MLNESENKDEIKSIYGIKHSYSDTWNPEVNKNLDYCNNQIKSCPTFNNFKFIDKIIYKQIKKEENNLDKNSNLNNSDKFVNINININNHHHVNNDNIPFFKELNPKEIKILNDKKESDIKNRKSIFFKNQEILNKDSIYNRIFSKTNQFNLKNIFPIDDHLKNLKIRSKSADYKSHSKNNLNRISDIVIKRPTNSPKEKKGKNDPKKLDIKMNISNNINDKDNENIKINKFSKLDNFEEGKQKSEFNVIGLKNEDTIHSISSDIRKICKICLEPEDNKNQEDIFLSPCLCQGSMKYVHEKCLKQWIPGRVKKFKKSECEICKANYKIEFFYEYIYSKHKFCKFIERFFTALGIIILMIFIIDFVIYSIILNIVVFDTEGASTFTLSLIFSGLGLILLFVICMLYNYKDNVYDKIPVDWKVLNHDSPNEGDKILPHMFNYINKQSENNNQQEVNGDIENNLANNNFIGEEEPSGLNVNHSFYQQISSQEINENNEINENIENNQNNQNNLIRSNGDNISIIEYVDNNDFQRNENDDQNNHRNIDFVRRINNQENPRDNISVALNNQSRNRA